MTSADTETLSHIVEHPAVDRARRLIREWDEQTLELQVELTEIPAPPFGEETRGIRMAEHFREIGLDGVVVDEVGNVIADLPVRSSSAPESSDRSEPQSPPHPSGSTLLVTAHLDTVFEEGTDVRVRRKDDRLVGPGISDDGRGLAALLTLARLLVALDLPLAGGVRFVATVGEEGRGDLRGVRHLFSGVKDRRTGTGGMGGSEGASGFISLDGAGLGRIVTRGLGVRRLRLTVSGPGGHSWVDRDAANPIHALARAVGAMDEVELSGNPPVGLTVSRWGGGSSINAVPRTAWVELDLRSESGNYLRNLEDRVRRLASGAVAGANARARARSSARTPDDRGTLTLDVRVIGDRPPGSTDPDSPLVQAAVDATRAVGQEPELVASSTDSNVPMSLGIPAITMGAGGEAGNTHTPDEWFRNRGGPEGIFRAFLTIVLSAGLTSHPTG